MVFLILIPATVLMLLWLALLFMVNQEDWVAAAYAQVVDDRGWTRSGRRSWPSTMA